MKRILVVAMFAFAAVAGAQEYRIDSVGLTLDSTIPERIVRSESLLEAGRTYSREDLDQALYRIRRIPFVFSASYTVEPVPGSDGYAVIFQVSDERAFFYEVDAVGTVSDDDESGSVRGGIGGRMYVPGGALEGTLGNFAASGSDTSQTLGLTYRGFGILGTDASASFGVSQDFGTSDDSDPTLSLGIEIPITLRQSVKGSATRFRGSRDVRFGPERNESIGLQSELTVAELSWELNTLNDPTFMTSGLLVSAGPAWVRSDSESVVFTDADPFVIPRRSTQTALALRAERYWAAGQRGALFGRFRGTESGIEQERGSVVSSDLDYRTADLSVGYGRNFGAFLDEHGDWRARLEVGGGWNYHRSESSGSSRSSDDPYFSLGGSFRHPWGRVKITASYVVD